MNGGHWIAQGALFVRQHPAVWPAVFFPLFFGAFLALSRSGRASACFVRWEPKFLAMGGAACLGIYALCSGLYLHSGVFHDVYESTQASVTSLFLRGDAVYAGLNTEERYSGPYGPALYLALGVSQWILGPSVFSTKLPGVLAALLSVGLFWRFIRRQHGAAAACAFAGLEAALLLSFRQMSFWAKPDPLILLCVTVGLCAARRESWGRVAVLGVCLGLAVDLKPHAAAYFLPVFVVAYGSGGWGRRSFMACSAVGAGVAMLPFLVAARQFSLLNYLNFLRITASEGFGLREALGYCRWVGLLAMLIYVAEKLTKRANPQCADERRTRNLRVVYRTALAVGTLLVATPAAIVGADQHHLIPFIPLVLIAVGDQFANRAGNATARLRRRPAALWHGAAYAALAACALVSAQTLWRITRENALRGRNAEAYLTGMRELLAAHPRATVLVGAGDQMTRLATFFRHEAVFAGNPVGIDAAAAMDYQKGGVAEPNLGRLAAEVKQRNPFPVWWVFPRGAAPFLVPNIYDARPTYSEAFRRDFHDRYELREQTPLFDLYACRNRSTPIPEVAVTVVADAVEPLLLVYAQPSLRRAAAEKKADRDAAAQEEDDTMFGDCGEW